MDISFSDYMKLIWIGIIGGIIVAIADEIKHEVSNNVIVALIFLIAVMSIIFIGWVIILFFKKTDKKKVKK